METAGLARQALPIPVKVLADSTSCSCGTEASLISCQLEAAPSRRRLLESSMVPGHPSLPKLLIRSVPIACLLTRQSPTAQTHHECHLPLPITGPVPTQREEVPQKPEHLETDVTENHIPVCLSQSSKDDYFSKPGHPLRCPAVLPGCTVRVNQKLQQLKG